MVTTAHGTTTLSAAGSAAQRGRRPMPRPEQVDGDRRRDERERVEHARRPRATPGESVSAAGIASSQTSRRCRPRCVTAKFHSDSGRCSCSQRDEVDVLVLVVLEDVRVEAPVDEVERSPARRPRPRSPSPASPRRGAACAPTASGVGAGARRRARARRRRGRARRARGSRAPMARGTPISSASGEQPAPPRAERPKRRGVREHLAQRARAGCCWPALEKRELAARVGVVLPSTCTGGRERVRSSLRPDERRSARPSGCGCRASRTSASRGGVSAHVDRPRAGPAAGHDAARRRSRGGIAAVGVDHERRPRRARRRRGAEARDLGVGVEQDLVDAGPSRGAAPAAARSRRCRPTASR